MDKKKERKIGLIMAVIISACMGIVTAVMISKNPNAKTPALPIFLLINVVESIIVGVIIALVIPLGKLGQMLAAKCKAVPPSLKFNLLNSIPLTLGNSLIVSAIVSFINIAQAHSQIPADQAPPLFAMWLGNWAPLLIPTTLIGYVLAILISPLVIRFVMGAPAGKPGPRA